MESGREQHYIPRLYLKHFASTGTPGHLQILNIRSGLFLSRAAWRNQAKEKDYYGTAGLDSELQRIESQSAPLIDNAVLKHALPSHRSRERHLLYLFVASLKARTKAEAKRMSEMFGETIHRIMLTDPSISDVAHGMTVRLKKPQTMSVVAAIEASKTMHDLDVKLLVNSSNTPFITSDSPVVTYNQFSEHRKLPHGTTGFASRGLQMFLPLSPVLCLVLFDKRVYHIGRQSERLVEVSEHDIRCLNRLQLLDAEELVFSNAGMCESELKCELEAVVRLRGQERFTINMFKGSEDGRELVHVPGIDRRLHFQWSFARFSEFGKRCPIQPFATQLRDESLRYRKR